jgi:hypothetical protein
MLAKYIRDRHVAKHCVRVVGNPGSYAESILDCRLIARLCHSMSDTFLLSTYEANPLAVLQLPKFMSSPQSVENSPPDPTKPASIQRSAT